MPIRRFMSEPVASRCRHAPSRKYARPVPDIRIETYRMQSHPEVSPSSTNRYSRALVYPP